MKTPWGSMMRDAARAGVAPADFWRLSLKEWRLLTEAPVEGLPLGRREFERMAEAWPDDG
ncbi:MAG: phage tail assembly chaperone [Brevundimonas sp.]|uniref:phage tail assembly chaperone n=2 Tax=Brevundimonas sp. TaxID=1871086 RepID=UPI0027EF47EA|nr:phage tail assembly chaperone [Brevundimonas sp.]MDI6623802.1 phage tail assembly chaperone [Brevundimonas sp.]MDQ7812637.1 phage tail assembly chaperone [Brevundimonas sp.]